MQMIVYFLICITATVLGAISGIGGGVIIKPVLDAVSDMSVSSISYMSGCTVLGMTVVSVIRSRKDEVKIKSGSGTLLAVGGAVGGIAGKSCFDGLKNAFGNDALVGVIQSVLMILLTFGVLIYVICKNRIHSKEITGSVNCLVIGLLLGIFSSFLGIGGGPINLAVLYYFFSMDSKTAALHSLYIILFSQCASLGYTALQGRVPEFDPLVLAVMIVGGILGGFIGRDISRKISSSQVDKLFRGMLVLIVLISCYNLYAYATAL